MERLEFEGTPKKPHVLLDPGTGTILLEGRCIVENAVTFFDPILLWIQEYVKDNTRSLVIDFKLEYFNTSSSKMILQMLLDLKEAQDIGVNITFNWYYFEDDEDILETAEEAEMLSGLKLVYHIIEA